jgi:hypothetical protein
MDQEAKNIRSDSIRLAWHMRGGATYEQIMMMTSEERQIIADLVKDNIETTKKTRLPWF